MTEHKEDIEEQVMAPDVTAEVGEISAPISPRIIDTVAAVVAAAPSPQQMKLAEDKHRIEGWENVLRSGTLADIVRFVNNRAGGNREILHTNPDQWTTPIHLAAQIGRSGDVVSVLVTERDFDASARDSMGNTPLHNACHMMRIGIARALIDVGADVSARGAHGLTPLHIISEKKARCADLARILISAGADVRARDNSGRCPFHAATKCDNGVLGMILSTGVDPNTRDGHRDTPLHCACTLESMWAIRTLVDSGADINALDANGKTPLDLIRTKPSYTDIDQFMINRGAKFGKPASESYDAPPQSSTNVASPTSTSRRVLEYYPDEPRRVSVYVPRNDIGGYRDEQAISPRGGYAPRGQDRRYQEPGNRFRYNGRGHNAYHGTPYDRRK